MSVQSRQKMVGRRNLLKGAAALGGVVGAQLPLLPLAAQKAMAQATQVAGGRPVKLTEFVWVGAGQGVVPREVNAAYEKGHSNVTVALYEGANTSMYPKLLAQRAIEPKNPLVNF